MMTDDQAKQLGIELETSIVIKTRNQPTPEQSRDLDRLGMLMAAAFQQARAEAWAAMGWEITDHEQRISGQGGSQFSSQPVKVGQA